MYRCSSRGKEQVIKLTSSPMLKRTQHSSNDFDRKRFKTLLDSQTFCNIFKNAPTVVERNVQFNTLGAKIFVDKDWANLFKNFEDSIDELVKEFY